MQFILHVSLLQVFVIHSVVIFKLLYDCIWGATDSFYKNVKVRKKKIRDVISTLKQWPIIFVVTVEKVDQGKLKQLNWYFVTSQPYIISATSHNRWLPNIWLMCPFIIWKLFFKNTFVLLCFSFVLSDTGKAISHHEKRYSHWRYSL